MSKKTLDIDTDDVRNAVADALERIGHSNPKFIAEIRSGERDDSPFMFGAQAVIGMLVQRERA